MGVLEKLKELAYKRGGWLANFGLLALGVLGLMAVVHNAVYQSPVDGAVWELDPEANRLVVTGVYDDGEDVFQLGDTLIAIDDEMISGVAEREDYLYRSPIGSRHLYVLERGGERYEPWVTIRGVRDNFNRDYYLYAFAGFLHLIFFLLVRSQRVTERDRKRLTFFCLLVYMAFVFHPTDRFSPMDWLSLTFDYFGRFLLPSAILALAIDQGHRDARWRPFFQGAHWLPSIMLLLLVGYWIVSQYETTGLTLNAESFNSLQKVQGYWGGGLIFCALLLLQRSRPNRSDRWFGLLWAVSWLPFALNLVKIEFPFASSVTALATIALPAGLVSVWSNRGELFLGEIGKKIVVYLTVALVLFLAYFVFLGVFRYLAGPRMDAAVQIVTLGLGVIFATASYNSLSQYIAEWVDRLIYGKRYESLQVLSDFAGINRADTNIDRFLFIIFNRVKNAFPIENGFAYKAVGDGTAFQTVEPQRFKRVIILDQPNALLLEGEVVRGHAVAARSIEKGAGNPIGPLEYVCPIRVTNRLAALIVFTTEEGGGRNLSPEELRLLKSLLHQCDVLMENMELYQTLHQRTASIIQLKEYNENIIESSRLGILTTDEMGRTVSANSALAEMAAIPKQAILGKTFDELFHVSSLKTRHQFKAGFAMEGRFENAKGEALELETQETPLRTKDNEVYGRLYLVEDVREKKKLRRQMMQQEKLASIGLLAAGVAHEINTPLTGIASYSQMLVADRGLSQEQKELLNQILEQSRRAANIVTELLDFSRKESKPKGPVDLVQALNQTLRFLSHQIQKRRVRVTVSEPNQPPIIEGYGDQIQQVFMNLIVNAMDAMPDGGDLAISFINRRRVFEVRVKDSGAGMDEQTRRHIFDPFFTTKEVGKGTGLGLAVVYNILRDHGAAADVESGPNQGSEFILFFPPSGQRSLPWTVKRAAAVGAKAGPA